MAEVIGLVASGVTIAQLVGQVANSVIKIKDFWNQVKAAPDDIHHLLLEVDSFGRILQHIQNDLAQNALPELVFDTDCVRQSLDLCRGGAVELEELANELTRSLRRKSSLGRKSGSVTIVLKQDELKRLKRRLKNAIRLLSLAYQCHTSAMIRLQPDIIIARLSISIMVAQSHRFPEKNDIQLSPSDIQSAKMSRSKSNNPVLQNHNYWDSSPSWFKLLLGSLKCQRRKRWRRGRSYEDFRARYQFPQLFSSMVWEIAGSRCLSEWSINIRDYRTVPWQGPIFRAIESGDISSIQKMLASKEAFVTDRSEGGVTLLHKAVKCGMADICSILISEGADVSASDRFDKTPLQYASRYTGARSGESSENEHNRITRLLVNNGACSSLVEEIDSMVSFHGQSDLFHYLQQQTYPPYYELSLDDRMKVMMRLARYSPNSAELRRIALSSGKFDKKMVDHEDESGMTILHNLIHDFARCCSILLSDPLGDNAYTNSGFPHQHHKDIRDTSHEWHKLIKDVIRAGSSIHAVNKANRSILCHIIWTFYSRVYYQNSEKVLAMMSQTLKLWLTDLKEVGVDLKWYVTEERNLHLAGIVDKDFDYYMWDNVEWKPTTTLIGFSYGPCPDDWNLWFTEPTDVLAGEFWAMVETARYYDELDLLIPGAWDEKF